jgi:hypothetical protein
VIAAFLFVSWLSAVAGAFIGRHIGRLEVTVSWQSWVNDQLAEVASEEPEPAVGDPPAAP